MSALGEPGEVVGAFGNVLQERRFRIDNAARSENTVDLCDDGVGSQNKFKHGLTMTPSKVPSPTGMA